MSAAARAPIDPAIENKAKLALRGYQPLYRTGLACPGCSRHHWLVSRLSAECAFCGTALPLAPEPLDQ